MQLSNRSYDFPEQEWHDQAQCWIGSHKGTGDLLVLACAESTNTANLQMLATYAAKRVRKNKGFDSKGLEYILAVKEGDLDETGELNGYPLRTVSESRLLDDLVNFDDYFRDLHIYKRG